MSVLYDESAWHISWAWNFGRPLPKRTVDAEAVEAISHALNVVDESMLWMLLMEMAEHTGLFREETPVPVIYMHLCITAHAHMQLPPYQRRTIYTSSFLTLWFPQPNKHDDTKIHLVFVICISIGKISSLLILKKVTIKLRKVSWHFSLHHWQNCSCTISYNTKFHLKRTKKEKDNQIRNKLLANTFEHNCRLDSQ